MAYFSNAEEQMIYEMRVNISEGGKQMQRGGQVFSVNVWPWVCNACGAVNLASYKGESVNCDVCLESQVHRAGEKQPVAVVLVKPLPRNLQARPVLPLTDCSPPHPRQGAKR